MNFVASLKGELTKAIVMMMMIMTRNEDKTTAVSVEISAPIIFVPSYVLLKLQ